MTCSYAKRFEKSLLGANIAIVLLAVLLTGYLQVCAAQQPSQKTFPSAEEASRALFAAVQSQDTPALVQILGERNELISSNDPDRDKLEREQFVHKYQEMHRLVRERNRDVVLYIGAENWPFPIPLVSANGVWRFDSDAGAQEVLFRRIGENELTAIEACHALIATLKKPQAHADAGNPVGALLAAVKEAHKAVVFQGYSFRILPKSGDNTFAIVAYPAAYGSAGVMTFIVGDREDVVYEKDLGPSTAKVASTMAAYHRDSTWIPAEMNLEIGERPGAP